LEIGTDLQWERWEIRKMLIFLLKKLGDMKIMAIFVSGYVADRDGEIRLEVDEEKGVELLGLIGVE
jgi:hypothetical protein